MSQTDTGTTENTSLSLKDRTSNALMNRVVNAINDADEEAAAQRVHSLRQKHPNASQEELTEALTKQKCIQAGVVGAVTSGASIIPGLGTLASLTFGVAADIGMTFRLQAELVLELSALYEHQLDAAEKRNVVLLVTGISAGANQMLGKIGTEIAEEATERLVQKSVTRAIPVLGVAASAGTNILTTYIIGRRAQAYFSLGPEAVGSWSESLRAISGVDERKLAEWLSEAVEFGWQLANSSLDNVAGAVIVVGKSAGELIIVGAGKAGETAINVTRAIAERVGPAAGAVFASGRRTGERLAGAGGRIGQRAARWATRAASAAGQELVDQASGLVGHLLGLFGRDQSASDQPQESSDE